MDVEAANRCQDRSCPPVGRDESSVRDRSERSRTARQERQAEAVTRHRLDLNNPEVQSNLFALQKEVQFEFLTTLRRISKMSWEEVYRDGGLRWEACISRKGPRGERL